jgi:hypothetical protein
MHQRKISLPHVSDARKYHCISLICTNFKLVTNYMFKTMADGGLKQCGKKILVKNTEFHRAQLRTDAQNGHKAVLQAGVLTFYNCFKLLFTAVISSSTFFHTCIILLFFYVHYLYWT